MSSTDQLNPPVHKRRWYQYSLRSLLIFMLVAGTGFGLLGIRVQQRHRQKIAADTIVEAGGELYYDYQCEASGAEKSTADSPAHPWLRAWFGNEFFDSVVAARFSNDEQLAHVKDLPDLKALELDCSPVITDAGLANLRDASQLERLRFGMHEKITDAGLAHLSHLTHLKSLNVEYLHVSDTAFRNLQPLTDLEELTFGDFNLDAGLANLRGMSKLHTLTLRSHEITDAGLEHLKGLTHLLKLHLSSSRFTDAGLEHLRSSSELESLYISGAFTEVGIRRLGELPRLNDLNISCSKISDEGLKSLPELTSVRHLSLHGQTLTDAGECLGELRRLKSLSLNVNEIDDSALDSLKNLTQLKELDLPYAHVPKERIATLQQALPNCRIISN